MNAPKASTKEKLLNMHGHTRVDPYYWMRLTDAQKHAVEPDIQTREVLDYLNAENDYTNKVLAPTLPLQDKLYHEMVGRVKHEDNSVPYFKNGYWYYMRFEEGKEYPLYCRKRHSLEADEIIMLDVNELAKGHRYFSAAGLSISPDNKWLAFATDSLSRRVYTIRFKNLETGEITRDKISNASPGGAWANDNQTYFYTSKNNVSLLSEKIWRHKLGTRQKEDVLVFYEKDPSFYIGVYRSKSGKYIIIYNSSTLVSDYSILDANTPNGNFHSFTQRGIRHEYSIEHFENKFYIVTNWKAMNFRLMETPEEATSMQNWKEVIPHREDVLLEKIEVFKDYLVINERSNALTQLRIIHQHNNETYFLDFGEPAYVAYISTNPEFNTSVLRYGYSSLTTPSSTIDFDMQKRSKTIKKVEEVVGGHDPNAYKTERVFATGRDGVRIPISLVYKKGLKKNGETPTVLYGYGSYGNTIEPTFNSARLSLLNRGFIWAIAHIRGGKAKGKKWYENGRLMQKMNTFHDFIDSAEFLENEGYTSPPHLYALGGSAGGLLMGAVINMAPNLFKGVIAAVPFVDVVSTMLDETIPLTTNEFDEWGNPKNKNAYKYMLQYSPYDNVVAQDYPNLLVTAGLFDSQVQYWEPAKWVAKLRATKTDRNLLLLHTNMEAGHGGASGRFKRIRETAMQYAFFLLLENIVE